MNAVQHDKSVSCSSTARVVGYAVGQELEKKLAEGFLCGLWTPRKQAYAVLRRPAKRGRRSKLSDEQAREYAALFAAIRTAKARIRELQRKYGVSKESVRKAAKRVERERS